MRLMDKVFMMVLMICMAMGPWVVQHAHSSNDLADTPFFSGMPSHSVIEAADKDFDTYRFCLGKIPEVVEGKVWRKLYNLKEGAKQPSDLQITRNYANAVRNMGGTVLFEGDKWQCVDYNACGRILTGKVAKGGKELWVEVTPCNEGFDYWLTVVEREGMQQAVTANDLLTALNKDGRVSLYINFDTGKSSIKLDSQGIIQQMVELMNQNLDLKLTVEGHTDNVGKPEANKLLSEQRAKAVVQALVKEGIDQKRLKPVGYGQEKPVADNSTPEGRAKNRRVELVK